MNWNNFFFKIKYSHIIVLLITIVIAFFIFANTTVVSAAYSIGNFVYFGSFVSGMLFSLAITAPFGAGFWSVAIPKNIFLAAVCGGIGAALVDVLIFRFIKAVLHVKTADAKKSKYHKRMEEILAHRIPRVLIASLSFSLTGFLLGLPLPNNLDKVLVSSVMKINEIEVAIMSFIFFTITAFFFLSLRYTVPFALNVLGLA